MDYKLLALERVSWTANACKVSYGGGKFAFQTPVATAKITPFHKFPGAINIGMDCRHFPHHFNHFIRSIEGSATDAFPELEHLEPMRSHFGKLTAFSNAHVFDHCGSLVPAPELLEGYYTIACIVQLDGTWATDSKWGLKFKVLQVKIYGDAEAPPPAPPPPPAQFQFIEE